MPHLLADQRTFWLHVVVLVAHCVCVTISIALIFPSFENPTRKNLLLQFYGRCLLYTSVFVLQTIMMFMFWKLTRPAFRRFRVKSEGKTTFEPSRRLSRFFKVKITDQSEASDSNSQTSWNSDASLNETITQQEIQSVVRQLWGDEESELR
jgi:hypothetical protein